ncbi:MAG: homocysteine S-methyltransferase [Gemmatimonadota bacterium]
MKHDYRVLDGGLATELERAGADLSGGLWSARLLLEEPALIREVHRSYYMAGADVAISASYQASYAGFAMVGIDKSGTDRLLRRSVELAAEARRAVAAEQSRPMWVAASVGPYGATLHDGSEYHGDYGLSVAELRDFHSGRLAVLAGSGADLLACETIPSLDEARALVDALHQVPAARAWLSFTSRDDRHTAHGEPLVDCARALDAEAQLVALGVNCVRPEATASLIRELRRGSSKPIVVYPNSGEVWDGTAQCWRGSASAAPLGALVDEWLDAGASWIGGCCRTTPSDIRVIRERVVASAGPQGGARLARIEK